MLKRKINFDDESDDENDWDYNANDGKKVENNEDMADGMLKLKLTPQKNLTLQMLAIKLLQLPYSQIAITLVIQVKRFKRTLDRNLTMHQIFYVWKMKTS